ncbi:hypothetical protein TKK_0014461 [Trichogramma kaykai]|uniref:Fe2OG dioxygenase domain-containing protein n=1 Tax=Trichogramma kaykai TaxID=54128 RepID=A0ABD2WEY5_9HYME
MDYETYGYNFGIINSLNQQILDRSYCKPAVMTPKPERETMLSRYELPVIDLAHVDHFCPQYSILQSTSEKLVKALTTKGVCILVNHGIPMQKVRAAYAALNSFLALPAETTEKYSRDPDTNHGYIKPGMERLDKELQRDELRHAYNVSKLKGPLPDKEVPQFRAAIDDLSTELKQMTRLLLTSLAMGLGKNSQYMVSKHTKMLEEGNESTMRVLYYPPINFCEAGVTRCGAHTDYGTLTLLMQDCEGGLEIQTPGKDTWTPLGHFPGAIIVNAGDILHHWTGGAVHAVNHRVVTYGDPMPHRHSLAFFVHPDNDAVIDEIKVLSKEEQQQQQQQAQREQTQTDATGQNNTHRKKFGSVMSIVLHLQRRFRETYGGSS